MNAWRAISATRSRIRGTDLGQQRRIASGPWRLHEARATRDRAPGTPFKGHNNGGARKTFTRNEFWVTPYDVSQFAAKNLPSQVSGGAPITNRDIGWEIVRLFAQRQRRAVALFGFYDPMILERAEAGITRSGKSSRPPG
jgi:hypothetical protein